MGQRKEIKWICGWPSRSRARDKSKQSKPKRGEVGMGRENRVVALENECVELRARVAELEAEKGRIIAGRQWGNSIMTKRWSSTASLDGKTKRQASKDARLDIKRETLDLEGAKSMGTKNNPGEFDCYANAEPDEPMFILLARDPSAPDAVLRWIECREDLIRRGLKPASDRNMLAEARQCAAAMIEWRKKHRPRAAQV